MAIHRHKLHLDKSTMEKQQKALRNTERALIEAREEIKAALIYLKCGETETAQSELGKYLKRVGL